MFIVYAIILFAILIFVHELGHLLSAKAVGIRVEEFALGMGPRIFSFERGGTVYSLRPIPIGGFCRMEGEDEDSEDPHAFNNRPLAARILVLLSGSLMNVLLAILVLWIFVFVLLSDHSFGAFFKSFAVGVRAIGSMSKMMYEVIGQLVTGQAGLDQLTGPVGIVKVVGDSASRGFSSVMELMALISLNLGIVNLLPFPALDGGRILFQIIRKITGKAISDTVEARIHIAGLVLLFGLMIWVTFIDVGRFFK
jgi:regulator of sigma E protease